MVCDPQKNALLKIDSKSDRTDLRKLEELRARIFSGWSITHTPAYELARGYDDHQTSRLMGRLKNLGHHVDHLKEKSASRILAGRLSVPEDEDHPA